MALAEVRALDTAQSQTPTLTDAEFADWHTYIEDRLGHYISDQRRTYLKTCLITRMRAADCATYDEYYQLLQTGNAGLMEWRELIDSLTIQETRFFRDPAAYALARDHLKRRIRQSQQTITLWSVGCATGEEPYSLAMIMAEIVSRAARSAGSRFSVIASDVSKQALTKAQQALYGTRDLELVDPRLATKYFQPHGQYFQPLAELRQRVSFVCMNLLDVQRSPLRAMDLIYCQNVLIYFRKWRRKEIVAELVKRLAPGGLLILGLGELADWSHPELQPVRGARTLAFIKRQR